MQALLEFVEERGIDALVEDFNIKVGHFEGGLCVLNYDQVKSPRASEITCACRGTVLRRRDRDSGTDAKASPRASSSQRLSVGRWELVARSFLRFFQVGEDVRDEGGEKVPQELTTTGEIQAFTKEDGTLILLWFDEHLQSWRGSCRFNLLDDFVSSRLCTYRELFQRVFCGTDDDTRQLESFVRALHARSIDDDANNKPSPFPSEEHSQRGHSEELERRFQEAAEAANLDRNVCYSFELCSPLNRVVTPYPDSSLCLLAGHRLDTTADNVELNLSELDAAANRMGLRRPKRSVFSDMMHVTDALAKMAQSDPTFEGFVLLDQFGVRLKAKNPGYFLIHKLRYRGWVRASPEKLVPFLLQNEDSELLAVLEQYDTVDVAEVRRRLEECRSRLHDELQLLQSTWNDIRSLGPCADFHSQASASPCKTWTLLHRVMKEHGPTAGNGEVDLIFRSSEKLVLQKLFGSEEEGVDPLKPNHLPAREYCRLSQLKENDDLPLMPESDGLAPSPIRTRMSWAVTCYCGSEMVLERLKADLLEKRFCFCGRLTAVGTIKSTSRVWRCTRCVLFHNAEFKDGVWLDKTPFQSGDPMGIPCSEETKVLRLMIHGEIRRFMSARKVSFEDAMKWLAGRLDTELGDVRIARLGARLLLRGLEVLESANMK